jgi:membrane associated rhomboid family serine protease
MFPISDDNPHERTPVVTWTLIAICVLVFLWQVTLDPRAAQAAFYGYGLVPARLFAGAELPPEIPAVPAWATVVTSMFMHGGWLHLGSNMLFLWIFGDNVEDSMGRGRYIAFYLACGLAAAMAQAFVDPSSTIPMVGASGAISGVLGAYVLLHPRATVRTIVFFGFFFTLIHIPAVVVLGLWFAGQLVSALLTEAGAPGIAFWAHVGGFAAGAVLVVFFKRREVPLLQAPRSHPFASRRMRGPWG